MNIKNLKRIKTNCTVYDIEVEKDHSFIVSDCVLHNCLVCGSCDGKLYRSLKEAPTVPQHRGCRCIIIPYFNIDGDTRASKTGQVSDKVTFDKWLEQQDEKTQKDVLGATRYKLFKDGTSMKQFVDNGQIITLDKLATKLGDEVDINSAINSLKALDKYDVENPIKMADESVIKEASAYYNKHRTDEYVVKSIDPKVLETRQDWLDKSKLQDFAKGFDKSKYKGDAIRAVEYNGHIVLVDGNHRSAIALLKGDNAVNVEVLETK